MNELSLVQQLKYRFSNLGYSVFMKGNTLQVSHPSRDVTGKEIKSFLRPVSRQLNIEQQTTGRFTYVDIEEKP